MLRARSERARNSSCAPGLTFGVYNIIGFNRRARSTGGAPENLEYYRTNFFPSVRRVKACKVLEWLGVSEVLDWFRVCEVLEWFRVCEVLRWFGVCGVSGCLECVRFWGGLECVRIWSGLECVRIWSVIL